jgi:hypothetical protein
MIRKYIWDDAPHPVVTRHICHGGVDIGSIVETALPIITSIVQPELTPFVLGGEAALNLGQGIAQQRPFGNIALQLGEEAAGAAAGGQFGDFGFGGGGAASALDPGRRSGAAAQPADEALSARHAQARESARLAKSHKATR